MEANYVFHCSTTMSNIPSFTEFYVPKFMVGGFLTETRTESAVRFFTNLSFFFHISTIF
jgi:hypothetical protein